MIEKMRRKSRCRICDAESINKYYEVKEMFFGTGEAFLYYECQNCRCIQLADIPADMGIYYGSRYYSFESLASEDSEDFPPVIYEQKLLDVGCGAGKWLMEKAFAGYGNLYGCDPFIERDIQYGNRIFIKKGTIHDIEGVFDYIHFGDSFEHIPDSLKQMEKVKRLLGSDGICEIDMPVYPNAAVEVFGTNWYQWDAPRHLLVHSVGSMKFLCEQTGLTIRNINYNSNLGQFVVSYLYELGIPMAQIPDNAGGVFSQEKLKEFQEYTEVVNNKAAGDHASFYIVHK